MRRVVTWTEDRPVVAEDPLPGRSVAVGTFDGVHLGHQQVIAGCDTVVTFDPHPRHVLSPGTGPRLLTDAATKERVLAAIGVHEVVVIPFDSAWAAVDPATFVNVVLVERLGARRVSVGENFRFGVRGTGSTDTLLRDERFETNVVPMLAVGDRTVSSSLIRELIASGELEKAERLLGRPYSVPARVHPHGVLVVDPVLEVPPPGRYPAVVDGENTIITVERDGLLHGGTWPRSQVDICFCSEPERC